jgi:hypothetical protein
VLPLFDDVETQASRSVQYFVRATMVKDALKKGFLKQVRRIQYVTDWLDDQAATRQARKLQETYAPLVAKAEKDKDWDARDGLLSEWSLESNLVVDPVYERKGERLTSKARKYGITVSPKPSNNEETEDWRLSRAYGFWLPSAQLEQKLRHEIKIEQRASYDEFRKWATLSFAVAGFLLAFYSVRAAKQPDPCPRNYYRSDSGECVFAQSGQREKRVSSVQANPSTVTADKPSPARQYTQVKRPQ